MPPERATGLNSFWLTAADRLDCTAVITPDGAEIAARARLADCNRHPNGPGARGLGRGDAADQ